MSFKYGSIHLSQNGGKIDVYRIGWAGHTILIAIVDLQIACVSLVILRWLLWLKNGLWQVKLMMLETGYETCNANMRRLMLLRVIIQPLHVTV